MRMKHCLRLLAAVGMIAGPYPASGDWNRYENARFGYGIDIPAGFSDVAEADNNDGGVSISADGDAELRIWGSYLAVGDFKSDIAGRIKSDVSDGWAISYDRRRTDSASWSGSRGAAILYARAVKACDDSVVYFRLVYPSSAVKSYDGIIARLVKSLRGC